MVKNQFAKEGDVSLIPGWGRSPGEGDGNPFQYSCLEIPWTEERGRLQAQRDGCNLATKQQHIYIDIYIERERGRVHVDAHSLVFHVHDQTELGLSH